MSDTCGGQIDHAALLDKLEILYREVGRPSYRRMAKLAESMIESDTTEEWRPLSASHLSNIMKGRFTRLPGWPLIRTIVTVLYKSGTMNGRMEASPQVIGALTKEFAEVWDAIDRRDFPARQVPLAPDARMTSTNRSPRKLTRRRRRRRRH